MFDMNELLKSNIKILDLLEIFNTIWAGQTTLIIDDTGLPLSSRP